MSTLASGDLVLVERSNTVYKETFGNRANIEDTDLLLVERSNTVYKCTYGDWKTAGGGGGGSATGTHGWAAANNSPWELTVQQGPVSGDDTAAYNYESEAMTVTGGDGADTGRLYMGMRLRGSTAYYHDFCLSHVQILQSNGTSYRTDSTYSNGYDWNFHNTSSTAGIGDWQKCNSSTSYQTYTADPSTLSYTTMASGSTNGVWNRATSTGSTYTGAADGTYSAAQQSGGGGTVIPSSTLSQQSGTYYLYTETSGSGYVIGTTCLWMRSPEITIHNGDILKFNYRATGGSNSSNGLGLRGDDMFYVRFK
jgi:hypothetical protein